VPRGKKALVFWVFAAVPFITGIIELAANLMQIFAEQLRSSTLSHQNLALEDQFKEHGKAIENLSAKIDTLSILLNKLTPQVDTSVSTDSLQSKDYFPQPTIDRSRYQDELPEQSSQPAPGTSSPDTSFKRQHTIADSLHSTRAKLRLSLERDDSIIDYHFKVTIKKYTPFAVSDLGLSKGFDDPRSPQAVRREIIRRKGQIEGLYRIAIRDTPNLNGSLTCRFTLDKFGEVIAFNIIKSSLNEPRFECQIWESMSRWQGFGIAKDETVKTFLVTYVFGE
jgi:hypothetical protein